MFNKLLEKNQFNRVTCVLIDELHLIGDDQRGYLLELLLTKLKFLSQKHQTQVIAMSATFPNLYQIS